MLEETRRRLAVWLQGDGIEIGALNDPLPLPDRARVRYVDQIPVSEQRRRYPELAGSPLAPVHVIARAEDLAPFGDESVDFVVANHLLEHLEDPIAVLREFERVLRPDGVLYVAIPDQRQTFDHERAATTPQHLLDEHRLGTASTRRQHYLDWSRNVLRSHNAERCADRLMAEGADIHFHCWQPDTFLDFFVTARSAFELDFEVVAFAPPEEPGDVEFVTVLVKGRSGALRVPPPRQAERLTTRQWLAQGPAGPPVRRVKRALRQLTGRLAARNE